MTRSLMTGITGLRTHQQKLDVVANNLANMNTIGFKAQTALFADLLYNNVTSGGSAGINPQEIGTGVKMAQVTRRFTQGSLEGTGELLDFAIQGEGFFVMQDSGGQNVYTRAGSFSINRLGQLVDPSSGYTLQRIGDVGEVVDGEPSFQTAGDSTIQVPLGAFILGQETRNVDLSGNLPSGALEPSQESLTSFSPFETAGGIATLTSPLNDLTINTQDYVAGDEIQIEGVNPDGSAFSGLFDANGATLGDLIDEINSLMTGATAELRTDGTIGVTADDSGEASMALTLSDATGNVGATDFVINPIFIETEGRSGETFELSMEIYDQRGESHRLGLEFTKIGLNSWDVKANLDPESGVLIDDSVLNVTFNEDGTFELASATGDGDANIEINFNSVAAPSTIELDFSSLTHLASSFSIGQTQDGFPPGNLTSVSITEAGELQGLASNGRTFPLAQLAMASFANSGALEALGGNYFAETLNSGSASIGEGLSENRGQLLSGQLENSNVDIAHEFTQLIVAQRGFSANARTITVADEMLEELTNIIR